MKNKIGFYTYYQIFNNHSGSDQLVIANKIKKLIINLEKDINQLIKNKNYRFKIYFDLITKDQATLAHFEDVLSKHPEISIICQVPNYFPKADLPEEINNLICFDSFRILPDGYKENFFKTPLSSGPEDEAKISNEIFKNHKLSYLILSEKTSINPDQLKIFVNEISENKKNNNFSVIHFNDWKDNNYTDLKSWFSNLNSTDIVFFDKDSFTNISQTVQGKISNRAELLKVFSESNSKGSISSFRIDSRTLSKIFEGNEDLPNILNFVGEDFFKKLELQERILSIGKKGLTPVIEQYLSWYFQIILDKVQLVASVCYNSNLDFKSKSDFIKKIYKAVSKLDGKHDVFIGPGEIISFTDNKKTSSSNYLTTYYRNAEGEVNQRLFPTQYFTGVQINSTTQVSYPNFDFIRLNNISIESGLFDAAFYLELTSPHKEGINILRFNNIDSDNLVVETIMEEKLNSEYWYYRYLIKGSFKFFPSCENYPFDKQVVFISYSLADVNYGILQPIQMNQVDREFNSDGWKKQGFRSGIIRKKDKYNPVFKESYILINEDNRLGMILSRPSSFAIIKIIIPLIFLLALVVYALYLPLDKLEITIALLTTSFLSAIALYFSTERPSPLVITTIDLMFLLFYLFVGIGSGAIFIFSLYPEKYEVGIMIYRWFSLLIFLFGIFYLIKRIKSKKFAPKIIFDDKN